MPPEHAGFLVPGVSECAAAHSILQGSPLRCSIHILGSRLQEGCGVGVVPPARHRRCSTQTAGECMSLSLVEERHRAAQGEFQSQAAGKPLKGHSKHTGSMPAAPRQVGGLLLAARMQGSGPRTLCCLLVGLVAQALCALGLVIICGPRHLGQPLRLLLLCGQAARVVGTCRSPARTASGMQAGGARETGQISPSAGSHHRAGCQARQSQHPPVSRPVR